MKKIIRLFLIVGLFTLKINNIIALEPASIQCNYDLAYKNGEKYELLTNIQVAINGYNTSNPSIKYKYIPGCEENVKDDEKKACMTFKEYTGTSVEVEYGGTIPYPTDDFVMFAHGGISFIEKYKVDSRCPALYLFHDDYISVWAVSTESHNFTGALSIDSKLELLSKDGTVWYGRDDFYANSGIELKEDRICAKDGEGYSVKLNSIENPFKIKFITEYNTSGVPRYSFDIDGHKKNIDNLDIDYTYVDISNIRVGYSGAIYIYKDQLKEIFESDNCPEVIYSYLHKDTGATSASMFKHVITTNVTEASENGFLGEYDDGELEQIPQIGFGEGGMKCSEILGENITKILKSVIAFFKIIGIIICTVQLMLALIPPLVAKDADALKKSTNKIVLSLVILILILLINTIISLIGGLFGYDLSCF